LLSGASPHCRRWETTADDRRATLLRHVCKDGRRLAVCGAPALRRLDRRTSSVMIAGRHVSSITNIATANQERLVIVGATGMVGGYALRYALENPAVASVTAIGRKTVGISHAELKEVLHQDFADCSALAETLVGQGAAIFCLGTYTGAVSDAELRTIAVDYTIEFARVLRLSSPDAAFSFLSGKGADPTGRSRLAVARYKGEAEKALLAVGFPSVYIFRPAYIYPVDPRKEPNFSYRLLRAIYPAFRVLFPNQMIPAEDLARAMVDVAVRGTEKRQCLVFETRDIRAISGKRADPGQAGELIARGANVMRGYWNNPEETAATFREGFFHTGDIGHQDTAGYFYILDRLKDMIVTGGENVYSGEVEAVIYSHPAVREVAVFGVPDAQWGELVM